MNDFDELAAEVYDYCCANRADNKSKNPREVGAEFDKLVDNVKEFYRNIVLWHLKEMNMALNQPLSYGAE
jgi:hypothetical protein